MLSPLAPGPLDADVLVYGGTPGGVIAAVAAARAGASVVLLEPTSHIGGMMSSGLSWTDRGDPTVIGGLAAEFFDRMELRHGSYGRYAFPPHSAEEIFTEMLEEAGVDVRMDTRLEEADDAVVVDGTTVQAIRTEEGATLRASAFIDAGYEGDLLAGAGLSYRVGRESAAEYGESVAGVRPSIVLVRDMPAGLDLGFPTAAPGPVGSGDERIQNFNYRVCLTRDPTNQAPFPRPQGYDASRYDSIVVYMEQRVASGEMPRSNWVMHYNRLVESKLDMNEVGGMTFGIPGLNYAYPEASYAERAAIEAEHRAYQQGFLYFLATDPRVPDKIAADANDLGLCADEFVDNGNWPWQLYQREGRRLVGDFVVTQHDIFGLPSKRDIIGLASYPMDSHIVSRWLDEATGDLLAEGGFYVRRDRPPWALPYRLLTPKADESTNLLVAVAVSSSRVAQASLRMEPQYMIMGHAAGEAAAMAASRDMDVQDVPIAELQARLLAAGANLTDPGDIGDSIFYDDIAWAYHANISDGCAPGLYCPESPLTRGQMATLLVRALDLPPAEDDHFADDDASIFEGSINALAEAGITTGCGPAAFCPEDQLIRSEMAALLARAFDLPLGAEDRFVDDEGSIHQAAINALAGAGIAGGCALDRFCPGSPVLRGQGIAFLHRASNGPGSR